MRKILLLLSSFLLFSHLAYSSPHLQKGDIVFQFLPSKLSSVIADVSESDYSHVGIVTEYQDKMSVIEAIGPVKYTPISEWINQGYENRITVMRFKNSDPDKIGRALDKAEEFLGRPYDLKYELDEQKIYCSELVYKAFKRGANIELGKIQKLKELKWKEHMHFIMYLEGGPVPLEREMVTPESIFQDQKLYIAYSNFPGVEEESPAEAMNDQKSHPSENDMKSERRTQNIFYEQPQLKGIWNGDYTIGKDNVVPLQLEFDSKGQFRQGTIKWGPKKIVQIISFKINNFSKEGRLLGKLHDSRGYLVDFNGQLTGKGSAISGNWKDHENNKGIFSLGKL